MDFGAELRHLRADLVMPEWVAYEWGIRPERHPQATVAIRPTGRARRRVPVRLVGYSARDLEGRPTSADPRSRWAHREAVVESVLREAAALAVVRWGFRVPPGRWDYRGTKHPRRADPAREWWRRSRDAYRRAMRELGMRGPDAEWWVADTAPLAVELDSGRLGADDPVRRVSAWLRSGVYAGALWVALTWGRAVQAARALAWAQARDLVGTGRVAVLYLTGWVDGSVEGTGFTLTWDGELSEGV